MQNNIKIANSLDLNKVLLEINEKYDSIVIDFIICSEDNTKILIQKRSPNRKHFPDSWEFTGGKLESDENIIDCITREMKEETSMELTQVLGLAHKFVWNNDLSVINLQFLVKARGEFHPEKDKVSDYKWIAKDEIWILNEKNGENQIYKGAFYAFGFLESLENNQSLENFSFASFLDELIGKFYLDKGILSLSPKVIVENLPDGYNIIHDKNSNTLKVDLKIITSSNLYFVAIVVLHDLYHNIRQGVESHDDVLLIRDVFDPSTMLLIDIDADIEIYKFFVKYYNFNFRKQLETLYNGGGVFRNTVSRLPKLQRFLGSMMSIYHYNLTGEKVVYFPSITKIHDKIFVLSISDGIKLNKIEFTQKEITIIINTFQNTNKITEAEFVDTLSSFVERLNISI